MRKSPTYQMQPIPCRKCGVLTTGKTKAVTCGDCRKSAKRAMWRKWNRRKAQRLLSTPRVCACGRSFERTRAGKSKLCPACAGLSRMGRDAMPHGRRESRCQSYSVQRATAIQQMLVEQAGRCLVCREPMRRPVVDHDHANGQVRGLLCGPCNLMVGHVETACRRAGVGVEDLAERVATHQLRTLLREEMVPGIGPAFLLFSIDDAGMARFHHKETVN